MEGKATTGSKPSSLDDVWVRVFRRLVPWAARRHRVTATEAEDLVQEGIAQLIRSEGKIDTADFGALLRAVGSRVNGVAVNLRRKKAARAVLLTSTGSFDERDDANEFAERLLDNDLARRAVNAVLDRLTHDELAFSVLGLMAEEVYEPAEQARQLHLDVADIYNARRRLDGHAKAVRDLMETWS